MIPEYWLDAASELRADMLDFASDILRRDNSSDSDFASAKQAQLMVARAAEDLRSAESGNLHNFIRRYKLALRTLSFASVARTTASPARWAVDPERQSVEDSQSSNYDRFGSEVLRSREASLQELLGISQGAYSLLLTSSGQAAYSTIEAFLLRRALLPGATVLVGSGVYEEALSQLKSLTQLRIVAIDCSDAIAWGQALTREPWSVAFADPMSNTAGLPTCDIWRALATGSRAADWSMRWIVVDGTMVSGGFDIRAPAMDGRAPRLLYYESASKYLQLGLDQQLAGIVVVPSTFAAELSELGAA